jgi:hypothetical protein
MSDDGDCTHVEKLLEGLLREGVEKTGHKGKHLRRVILNIIIGISNSLCTFKPTGKV